MAPSVLLLLLLLAGCAAAARTAVLTVAADNTLCEDAGGALSNALSDDVFVGRTRVGLRHRGLLHFDLAPLPARARVLGARLELQLLRAPPDDDNVTITVHRVARAWGSNASRTDRGTCAAATRGDATWLHTFYPDAHWAAPGGDYAANASAAATVGFRLQRYGWESAALAADVQAWLRAPAANYGWLLLGDETANETAKEFASREVSLNMAPMLTVTYAAPTPRVNAAAVAVPVALVVLAGLVAGLVWWRRRARSVSYTALS